MMKFYLRMKAGKHAHKCWWSLSLSAGRRTIAHPHWSEGLLLIQEEERGDGMGLEGLGGIKMNPPGSCERANISNSISSKCFPYSDKMSGKCTRHIDKVSGSKY